MIPPVIYDNACRTIARRVGLHCIGQAAVNGSVGELAEAVGLVDQIARDPVEVAISITEYLDELVRNP